MNLAVAKSSGFKSALDRGHDRFILYLRYGDCPRE
jgi:hypothetical protein